MSLAADKQRQALSVNILTSEIKRYTYMTFIFGFFAAALRVIAWIYPEAALLIFKTPAMVNAMPAMPGIFAVYALLFRYYLARMQKSGRELQPWFQYFSSLFEITIVTAAVWSFSWVQEEKLTILLTPFPLVYFVFIIFSILRLRPALCIFTGVAAGLEYLAFYLAFYEPGRIAAVSTAFLYIPPPHFIRVLIFIASGVLAGYVARQISENLKHSFEKAQEAERVTQMFGRYVSDKVAEKLLSAGEMEAERPEATAITVLLRA
jgi:K+-sensing histidine kinase KdpD